MIRMGNTQVRPKVTLDTLDVMCYYMFVRFRRDFCKINESYLYRLLREPSPARLTSLFAAYL